MIVEIEVLEQIREDAQGWELQRVCDLIDGLDKEPFTVLRGMWRAQRLVFLSAEGLVLPDWRCKEILREEDEQAEIRVASRDPASRS